MKCVCLILCMCVKNFNVKAKGYFLILKNLGPLMQNGSPRPSTSRRHRPSRHARRRAYQQLLRTRRASPGLKACPGVPLDFFYPFHRAALPFFPSSTRVLSPELRLLPRLAVVSRSTTFHPLSSAPVAPLPPIDAHRPAQFHSPALEQPDHRVGELKLRRRSDSPSSRRSVASQPPPSAPPAPHHPEEAF
jgi:hypothetical protein